MKVTDFDYYLPKELIAQTPIEPRDASKLLVLDRRKGTIEHRIFREIVEYLRPGDVIVCNDSKVIPAHLLARKLPTGGKVEVLLVTKREERVWEALTKGRKVRLGTRIELLSKDGEVADAIGKIVGMTEYGGRIIEFNRPLDPLLKEIGEVPLPPYIHEQLTDPERYQTVYARKDGSIAAPTAGLHFTTPLIESIKERGVDFAFVTLHIGLDTFRPVKEKRVEEHKMYREYCILNEEVSERLRRAKEEGGRIIAVGTSSVRVLETAACGGSLSPFEGWTDLFIYPGYRFRVVDCLITNFHLPRTTTLMLVMAFAGRELIIWAYNEAIRRNYRLLSFGDAIFIL
jgi:S-adenosylmethionine:tRNA ribosyltransferase-isomerase